MSYFPFEEYISSLSKEEYSKDINMRNSIVKYVNAILVDPEQSVIPLRKFLNICLFFKNTFCKEAFLYYYLNRFDEEERSIMNKVIFDIFIMDEEGNIGEHRKYYELAFEVYSQVDLESPVISSWDYVKNERV